MPILRYPSNLESQEETPWILFSSYAAAWRSSGRIRAKKAASESVAIYIPTGTNISDSLTYDTAQAGVAASLISEVSGTGGLNIRPGDVEGLAGLYAGRISRQLGDVATPGIDLKETLNAVRGRVANPNSFTIFNSPSLRTFPFNFTFIPQNEQEADSIPEIIKFFRKASYPSLAGRFEYNLPNFFSIRFEGTAGMIKIPEVVCTSVQVSYNPNSISYFKRNNQPVETTLSLSFQETQAITRQMVEEGY